MPLNKNATIRYQALDKCFSDFRHRYYIDDLIDACAEALIEYTGHDSVSRRTVFEDITFMESEQGWSIPLERHKDGKKVYYRYKYKDFSINNQELTADEISQLKTTILTISRYRGLPSTEWLEDVISNLEYRFGLKSHSDNVLSFEQNVGLKGIEHLSTLIDAASNKQTLSIRYKNFEGKEELWTIYPYYLKQYNNRWFLFGWNEKYDSLSNMALDRIEEIKLTDYPFRENKDIDFNTYFDDIVGVSVGEKARMREWATKNRFVDTIILLPKNLLASTNIPVVCLVLRKKSLHKDGVRMIDASDLFTNHRYKNYLSIGDIMNVYHKDTDKVSATISFEQIEENDFSWNVADYLNQKEVDCPDGYTLARIEDIIHFPDVKRSTDYHFGK